MTSCEYCSLDEADNFMAADAKVNFQEVQL